MFTSAHTRKPACLLARGRVRLRLCVRADAFGNALGNYYGDQIKASQQEEALQAREDARDAAMSRLLGGGGGDNGGGYPGAISTPVRGPGNIVGTDLPPLEPNDINGMDLPEGYALQGPGSARDRARGERILAGIRDADPNSQAAAERAALARAKANNDNYGNEGRNSVAPGFEGMRVGPTIARAQAMGIYSSGAANTPRNEIREYATAWDGVSGKLPEEMSAGDRARMGSFGMQAGQNLSASWVAVAQASPPGLLVNTGFAALNGTTSLMNENYGDAALNGLELGLNFAGAGGGSKLMSMARSEQAALRLSANAERRASYAFAQDMESVGVTPRQIELMFAKELPLGFQNVKQFAQFKSELDVSLRQAGLADAEVGLKGTATTFYSENPGKMSGHYWDRDPIARGDYDINVTSPAMVNKLQGAGIMPSETYGVFKTRDMQRSFSPIDKFSEKWSRTLGRDVNFVGYPSAQARDATEYILRARK